MAGYTIGIDAGGTKTAYGLLDNEKKIIRRISHPSDGGAPPEVFFDTMADRIQELLDGAGIKKDELRGIGVGLPSFILFEEGRIIKTSNLPRIRDFPARSYLMKKLGGVRVLIDNDAHAAAVAEHRLGAGRGFDNMLYCPVSTGISSAIIINGRLFRGRYGWSGESGHMIATPGEGIECGCGNRGCYMSWCSGSMIVKHIRNWIAAGEKTVMTDLAGGAENITARHIERAFQEGDTLAVRAVDQMSRFLGLWTFNLYVTLNINCFVFGGGLVKMGKGLVREGDNRDLLARMKEVFDGYNNNDLPVYFKEAELGDDYGVIGAAELLF
ncbi:MAG: ROK family protein [Treponema sp.]|jgi:glucokinase|nr:ROK family protein [Treponema sp.]